MAKFIKSANFVNQYFVDNRNQFCFIGRSNAGKSSLINSLANEVIAKTSATPGKTKLVNFFDFNNFILVDLPGYGFAKTNKNEAETLEKIIFEYLTWSKKLICVFQLCSIDVITNSDVQMVNYLKKINNQYNIKHLIILTKSDKIKEGQIKNHLKKVSNFLKIDEEDIIPISNKTKTNIKKILSIINAINSKYKQINNEQIK